MFLLLQFAKFTEDKLIVVGFLTDRLIQYAIISLEQASAIGKAWEVNTDFSLYLR